VQGGVSVRTLLIEFLLKGIGRVSARECAVYPKASLWRSGITDQINDPAQQPFRDRASGWFFQGLLKIGSWTLKVPIESLTEQRLFVAKSRIKTRAANAHRFRQIGKRCSEKTLPPKQLNRLVQSVVRIEGAGSAQR